MVKAVSQRTKKWVEHKQNIKLEVAENSAELEFALHFGEGERGPSSDPHLLETRFLFQLPGRVARSKCAWVTALEGKRPPAARRARPDCRRRRPLPHGSDKDSRDQRRKTTPYAPGSQSRRGHLQARRNGGCIDMQIGETRNKAERGGVGVEGATRPGEAGGCGCGSDTPASPGAPARPV